VVIPAALTKSGVLKSLQESAAAEAVYSAFHRTLHTLLFHISPVLTARHRYRRDVGRPLPLDHPVTFDEKLLWLMLFWHPALKARCADKFTLRSYLEECGYGHLLVDLLAVYDRATDIDFEALPSQFVLKCSHGCGFNLLCPSKADLNAAAARRRLARWMRQDYALVHGEVHYSGLRPRILCERFLEDGPGGPPADYKLHCFHGRVHFTTVCSGRKPNGEGATYDHYDRDWTHLLPFSKRGVHPERWRPQPTCYPAMLEAAEALSAPFPYVRMDFYALGDRPLLGEMTFTPAGCIDTGYTDAAQRLLGDLIQLPAPLGRQR
jgi:hypothetical protein